MKFVAMVATNKPDLLDEQFSDNALENLCKQAFNVPLTMNFGEKVGTVTNAVIERINELAVVYVEGVAQERFEGFYAVPAFTFSTKNPDELKLREIALTRKPADPNLSPVAWLRDKE